MQNNQRNKKLLSFVKGINRKRKAQAKQIDILCNDIINMHRGFLQTLNKLAFTADFCELMIGCEELPKLLAEASFRINRQIGPCNIVFFLPQAENQRIYVFECEGSEEEKPSKLEQAFSHELIDSVFKSNKICMLDELLTMGLQVAPAALKNISAATVPICEDGMAAGLVLVYKTPRDSIKREQLEYITAVRSALSRAIRTCVVSEHTGS
ncbi:MAG: hypothetical protein WDA68_05660 [Phycisphaerae bacterium]